MKNGIDVSVYQGDIDWKAVRNSEIAFAIIKAGGSDAGFYKDSKFEKNYTNAKAVGMPVGAYYFVGSGCTSKADGIADAKRFLEIIKGKTFEYPVYIDLEATSPSAKSGVTEACIGFCETMENAGYYCGIYASDVSGFNDRLDLSRLSKFDKWVARYGSKPVVVKSYGIWQKSDSGRINGINGNVDLDEAYKDYPTIIKNAGLNGYKKPENPAPAPVQEKPAPQTGELSLNGKKYKVTFEEI